MFLSDMLMFMQFLFSQCTIRNAAVKKCSGRDAIRR